MITELVDKYVFLVQAFVEAGDRGLTYSEIKRKWENRYNQAYPRRSFINHRNAVTELFGIVITCDRSTNRYYIDRSESAVDHRAAVDYLINTFTVNSLLTLGKERLSGRVSVEDIPSGQTYLTSILQAMLENTTLKIGYRKYMSEESETRTIRPYAVKEFGKRWYVVAFSEQQKALRTYAMDRITALERTQEHFSMPEGFDVDTLFEASYGIYLPEDEKPVLVKLRTTLREAAYLHDLPLHPSQTLVEQAEDHCIFALRVIPNPNFLMDLCARGDRLEVLEPQSLREALRETLKKALQLYEN